VSMVAAGLEEMNGEQYYVNITIMRVASDAHAHFNAPSRRTSALAGNA
jgi:hypothetical protein